MSRTYPRIRHILDDLDKHSSISQYDVLKYEHTAVKFQFKLRIQFTDQSILFTNEYIGDGIRKYAFHWQQTDEQWLVRWDNVHISPKSHLFPIINTITEVARKL